MSKIKDFFETLWGCITFPYYWVATIGIDKKLRKIADEDRNSQPTEKDEETLKTDEQETNL